MKPGKFPRGGMGGGNMNMQAMLKKAQKMQEEMLKAQEELANKEYSATSGGGAVEVTVRGTTTISALKIKPEVVDPEDIEMLEDLIIAAVNEALRKADSESEAEMRRATGGMGLPGMNL